MDRSPGEKLIKIFSILLLAWTAVSWIGIVYLRSQGMLASVGYLVIVKTIVILCVAIFGLIMRNMNDKANLLLFLDGVLVIIEVVRIFMFDSVANAVPGLLLAAGYAWGALKNLKAQKNAPKTVAPAVSAAPGAFDAGNMLPESLRDAEKKDDGEEK